MSDTNAQLKEGIPKLRVMRDEHPITGKTWVVDENNHHVASFNVKLKDCHLKGSQLEVVNAGLNYQLAYRLIDELTKGWQDGTYK